MRIRLYLLALPLFALAAAPALAAVSLNKTVAATPTGSVQISNTAGKVKITAWDRDEIHIGGKLGHEAKRLAVKKSDGAVTIRVVLRNPHHDIHCGGFFHKHCTHLKIELPATSHLRVNTVSADVDVKGLAGPIRLQSTSGDFDIESESGKIHTQSTSGDADIEGSAPGARIAVQTTSGDVKAEEIHATLRVKTVSGDIEAEDDTSLSAAKLKSTSGDIEVEAALSTGDYSLVSTSGDIKLKLSNVPDAQFSAATTSGDIQTNFGPRPQRRSKYGPGRTWHYSHGSAKGRISIQTTSGDIYLRAAH